MASSSDLTENDLKSLSEIFKEGLDTYNALEKNYEPTNSSEFQANVKNAMKILEKATRLVSLANLFSRNEEIEEVATNDLQYFLLPVLLGNLTLKLTTGERKNIIEVAEVYLKDFMKRCNDYKLCNYELKDKDRQDTGETSKTELEELEQAAYSRAYKIQCFKVQKELKSKLENLKKNMENENVDEDVKREYYLTIIKLFIHETVDELRRIKMEKPLLEHMAMLKKDQKKPEQKGPPSKPLQPIIITKDEVQKAVFGAGYPSLPTMTVKEFYDKRVADGIFPDPNKKPSGQLSLQQAALAGLELNSQDEEDKEREDMEENDDPEYVERMRRMDEYKDDHRRGWGNRMNRS